MPMAWEGDHVEFGLCPSCESYQPAGEEVYIEIMGPGHARRRRACALCGTLLTRMFPVPLPRWVAEEVIRRERGGTPAPPYPAHAAD